MKTETIVLKVSLEEKHLITEASHEARMNTNAWIRAILMEHLDHIPTTREEVRPIKIDTSSTKSFAASIPGVVVGSAIEEPLWWTANDTEEVKEARKRKGWTNPGRLLFREEKAFNALTGVWKQKYDGRTGDPILNLNGDPINPDREISE